MHTMFFGVKRVHLRVLHMSRGLLREVFFKKEQRLTPARFDMMRIIKLYEEEGIPQASIQVLLGVSAPTVSRMLKSLEALGYVERDRLSRDRRCVVVKITELGSSTVATAMPLVDKGVAERLALLGLDFAHDVAAAALATLQKTLLRIRKRYADPSPVEHPWKMQDLVPYAYTHVVDGRIVYGVPAS
jgi:DNA-binding MarR family transcriptional regulator